MGRRLRCSAPGLWDNLSRSTAGLGSSPTSIFAGPVPCKNFGVWPHPNCLPKRATRNMAQKTEVTLPVCHTFRMQLLHRCLYPTVPAENSLNGQRIVKEISFWAIPVSTMVSHKDALPLQSILLLLRFLPAVFFHFFFHPLASWLSCALQLYIQSFLCCFRHLPCICHIFSFSFSTRCISR